MAVWMLLHHPDVFVDNSLSYAFVKTLKYYQEMIEDKCIPNLWYKDDNLLRFINPDALENISNRLIRIIKKIEKSCLEHDPDLEATLCGILLNLEELTSYYNEEDPVILSNL